MQFDLFAFISFVLITTFTPGPNNISSASMGILFGYQKASKYLVGITMGFFTLMLLCGWISKTLLQLLPSFEGYLGIIGAAYILYLAWHTFRASYDFNEGDQKVLGFTRGFLLQILNPKAIVFGLTVYSTFLGSFELSFISLSLSAAGFAGLTFAAISTWALFGAGIRAYLKNRVISRLVNTLLSLLLVYTAVKISGVLEIF
ncbi:LysE family translocator [Chloroflexota bacterium]